MIERRARALAQRSSQELGKIDGVKMWTQPRPDAKSRAIVIFQPGTLDSGKLNAAL